jgi:hypothetical protein
MYTYHPVLKILITANFQFSGLTLKKLYFFLFKYLQLIFVMQVIEFWRGGGARFSAPIQIGPGAHPACYTIGTEYFIRG